MKISIVKIPLEYKSQEMSWEDFRRNMWDIQKQIRQVKNEVTTMTYLDWKGQFDKGNNKLDKIIYDLMRSKLPELNTGNIAALQQNLSKTLSKQCKEILCGKQSLPSFKSNSAIMVHNKNICIYKENSKYMIMVSLFSNIGKKNFRISDGRIKFAVNTTSNSVKQILKWCISGEYSIGASQITYNKDDKCFELCLTYKQKECTCPRIDYSRIMGLDFGINNAYYFATNYNNDTGYYNGKDIDDYRKRIEAKKRNLSHQRAHCGNGSIGHGYKTRMKPVLNIKDSIAQNRNRINHQMSRDIIRYCIKHRIGIIQMEDLTGISTKHKFLKNWTYYDLQQKITYKAEKVGIKVVFIDPQYTSQRCFKCGYISDDSRPEKKKGNAEKFKCVNCGFETNADYNAARNIALPDIVDLIKKQCKVQNIKYKEKQSAN